MSESANDGFCFSTDNAMSSLEATLCLLKSISNIIMVNEKIAKQSIIKFYYKKKSGLHLRGGVTGKLGIVPIACIRSSNEGGSGFKSSSSSFSPLCRHVMKHPH
jgi:hypothetical protein